MVLGKLWLFSIREWGRNWEKSIGQPMAKGSSMLTYMYKENETEDVI